MSFAARRDVSHCAFGLKVPLPRKKPSTDRWPQSVATTKIDQQKNRANLIGGERIKSQRQGGDRPGDDAQ